MLRLTILIRKKSKLLAGGCLFLFAAIAYLTSNHFHIFPPHTLPISWVDRVVPFLPETVWIYVSEYVYFAVVYLTSRDTLNLNKFLYSFLSLQVFSILIFWLGPPAYPRDSFPFPANLGPLTRFVFASLRQVDTPANCFPSLHVSSVYLCSFLFFDEQREKFPFFFVWATAIALSTLTTKQHYAVDVAAGFGLAVIFYWLFHRRFCYRTTC